MRCRRRARVNHRHTRIIGTVGGIIAGVVYSYLSAERLERAWSSGDRRGMALEGFAVAAMVAYGLVLVRRLIRLLRSAERRTDRGPRPARYAVGAIDRGRKNPNALV